jgi:spoIIIJ-associated protein
MENLEVSGKTVDEAIAKALKQLGVEREDVNITILSEGKSGGLFGLGSEDARISVELLESASLGNKAPEPAAPTSETVVTCARETLEELLKMMGVEGKIVPGTYPDESGEPNSAPIAFNIEGNDLGILIGRRGQTLSSLQYILRLIVGRKTNTWLPIVIDAESYKQRRYEALQALAHRTAETVKAKGTPLTLEPMPPYERRIIHMALANHSAVFTESIGEGESRKVVIKPKKPATSRTNFSGPRNNGNSYRPRNNSTLNQDDNYNRW